MNVFQQLGEFGHLGGGHRNAGLADSPVESQSFLEASGGAADDHLGNAAAGEVTVPGIFPFGGIDEKKVLPDGESQRLDSRPDDFLGGAWISGALQTDGLSGGKVGEQRFNRIDDVAEIGFAVSGQGSGDADDDGAAIRGEGEIGAGMQVA